MPKPSLSGSFPPCTKQHFLNFCLKIQAEDTKQGVPASALSSGHSLSSPMHKTQFSINPPPVYVVLMLIPKLLFVAAGAKDDSLANTDRAFVCPGPGMCIAQHANASEASGVSAETAWHLLQQRITE